MSKLEFGITTAIFVGIFMFFIVMSLLGKGVPSYKGNHYSQGNTWFYSGQSYAMPSSRAGSMYGPNPQGGGVHSGK